jgi:hypothetical protein
LVERVALTNLNFPTIVNLLWYCLLQWHRISLPTNITRQIMVCLSWSKVSNVLDSIINLIMERSPSLLIEVPQPLENIRSRETSEVNSTPVSEKKGCSPCNVECLRMWLLWRHGKCAGCPGKRLDMRLRSQFTSIQLPYYH